MATHISDQALRALLRAYCTGPQCMLARQLRPQVQTRPLRSVAAYTTARCTPRAPIDPTGRNRGRRSYVTSLSPKGREEIAVVGGGLTGLTTAHYLTRYHPNAKITIYEKTDRLGGWVHTEKMDVKGEDGQAGTVNLEHGPRVVAPQKLQARYEDLVLYDLIDQLDLHNEYYGVSRTFDGLRKRYIYYPDHLVALPTPTLNTNDIPGSLASLWSMLNTVLTEPLFAGAIPSGINTLRTMLTVSEEAYRISASRDEVRMLQRDLPDTSIGDFFLGILGRPELIDNLLSALIHGVYGGDIWKLSVEQSMFSPLFLRQYMVKPDHVAVREHDFFSGLDLLYSNENVRTMAEDNGSMSYLGFYNGFGTLTDALAAGLRKNPNVNTKTGISLSAISYDKTSNKVEIASDSEKQQYDKVISTLFSGTLASLTGNTLPALKASKAVTMQVVILWYPKPYMNAAHPGFGYLIPQSVPVQNNPHSALGVLFDSDRDIAAGVPKDEAVREKGGIDSIQGTKLTVMLGGHHWDWLPADSWPDAKEATAMAVDTVERQLGIPKTEPVFSSSKVCREAISQQLVGHRRRMENAHYELDSAFGGKLAVAGGSYTAPGVLPSLKAARDIALQVAGKGYKSTTGKMNEMEHVGDTGLARFAGNEWLKLTKKTDLPYRFGNGA